MSLVHLGNNNGMNFLRSFEPLQSEEDDKSIEYMTFQFVFE